MNRFPWPKGRGSLFLASKFASSPASIPGFLTRNKYLADTTMLVELLRGNTQAKNFLENLPEISAVTTAELIQGSRDKNDLAIIEKTCNALPQIKIDGAVCDKAIDLLKEYYLSHSLVFLDALIAAMAIVKKKVLVTENLRDFKFIKGLEVISHTQAFIS